MKGIFNRILFVVALFLAAGQVNADGLRVVRSSVFPGMGQLGDDQKVRGLVYMVGEIALLTMTVEEVARSNSYARATEYLKIQYNYFDSTTEQHAITRNKWMEASDKSKQAQLMSLGLAAASAGWWAWNIIDALLFAPAGTDDISVITNIRDNLAVTTDGRQTGLSYRINF